MKKQFLFSATILCISLLCLLVSCKRLIEIDTPKNQLTNSNVFVDEKSATAVLGNIYYQFNTFISNNYTLNISLYSDELVYTNITIGPKEFSNSDVSITNTGNLNIWKYFYTVIYQCNALLENIHQSTGIPDTTVKQLSGEALFLRSYAYFYLVNLYGDVPLLNSTDVTVTSTTARTPAANVYQQILQDLQKALSSVQVNYPSADKARVNRSAVAAFLAKVYLYQKNYAEAEQQASAVIGNGSYTLENLPDVFLKGSRETILQFWTQNGYTNLASTLLSSPTAPQYVINNSLYNGFETGDKRKTTWLKAASGQVFIPFKYKINTVTTGSNAEYLVALRLAEQYLIRAEARLQLNNIPGARADINTIRNRAGLLPLTTDNPSALLQAIEQERRIELFTEWGNRFLDARRYNHIDSILKPLKPAWRPTNALLPIPQNEMQNNPNLLQNEGY